MKPKLSFQQEETQFKGKYQQQVFRTLKLAYQPYFIYIFLLLILGFIGRLVLLFNTNLIGFWVDSFCNTDQCQHPPLWFQSWTSENYLPALLVLCILGLIFTLCFRVGFSRLSALATSTIYDEVTLRTSRYPLSFFDTTPAGRIITRFSSDYGNVFRLFGGPLAEFIALVFDILSMIILITIASPFYLFLVFLIVVCNYWIFKFHKDGIRTERRQLSLSRAPSIAHFAETAIGASSIRTYLRQNSFVKKFITLNDLFLNQRFKSYKRFTFFSFQISALTSFLLLLTGLSSFYLLKFKLVSVGSIGVAFTFIMLSGGTVQTFFEWLSQLDEAFVGTERLDHYLHLPIEAGERLPSSAQFPTPHWNQNSPPLCQPSKDFVATPTSMSSVPQIQFENVSFRYREDLPLVLKNISFDIKPTERIGIIGKTGSGKSTLIQTLFYLYPLTQGKISINGFTPYLSDKNPPQQNEISLTDYRNKITLIPQDPILFRGTLRDNLDLGKIYSSEKVITSLDRVGLKEWFQSLSQGLEYPIEERGKNLSLGERQLLCMARCLLKDSPIIVMDEATSSVDPQSEQIMVNATQNFFSDRTQLIIAHRLSTVEHCDRILWLHQGEIKMLDSPSVVLPAFLKMHKNEVHL